MTHGPRCTCRVSSRQGVSTKGFNRGEWQPIETGPKDGRFVMLHVPRGLESGVVTVGAYWKHDERDDNGRFRLGNWDGWLGMDADTLSSMCEPTHWQPLPDPPPVDYCGRVDAD